MMGLCMCMWCVRLHVHASKMSFHNPTRVATGAYSIPLACAGGPSGPSEAEVVLEHVADGPLIQRPLLLLVIERRALQAHL